VNTKNIQVFHLDSLKIKMLYVLIVIPLTNPIARRVLSCSQKNGQLSTKKKRIREIQPRSPPSFIQTRGNVIFKKSIV
jgi:hypothetical protein